MGWQRVEGYLMAYLDENGNEIPDGAYLNEYGEPMVAPHTVIPPELATPRPTRAASWVEAAFPRASRAVDEGRGAGLASALDVYSLPWRALSAGVQSGAQALGAAMTGSPNDQETFQEAMARTGGSSQDPRFVQAIDQIVRAPENTAFAPAAALRGAAAIPAWMVRAVPAWGRGAVAGVELGAQAGSRGARIGKSVASAAPASAVVTGSAQGERVAAGQPVAPGEALLMLGSGLGLGALGPMMVRGGSGVQDFSGRYLTTVIDPTDKARRAGWSGRQALEELSRESPVGYVPMTLGGIKKRASEGISRRVDAREAAIIADEAAALEAGRPARVDLGLVSAEGRDAIDRAVQDRSLTGAIGFAQGGKNWLARELQADPYTEALVPIDEAIRARQGLDKFAFVPTSKGGSAVREVGAKAARKGINRQLDIVAPRTRAADADISRLVSQAEGLGAVLDRRLNRDMLTPMDMATGFLVDQAAGGGKSGLGAGLGAMVAQRVLRTPAPASIGYMLGSAAQNAGRRIPSRAAVAGPVLLKPATDNARGR